MRIETALNLLAHAAAAVAFTSVWQHLRGYCAWTFVLMFCLALYRDQAKTFTVPRWVVNGLSVLVLLPALAGLGPERLLEPILEGLLLLLGLKLLEEKKTRDHLQICLLCVFLLVGSSLLSVSAVFLVHFVLLNLLLTTSLMTLTHQSHLEGLVLPPRHFLRIQKSAATLCAAALLLSTVFFVLLPRTPHPFLSLLSHRVESRSGFSDKVSLGEVSAIQLDSRAVFRAVMNPVEAHLLYWRGIVLDEFTGVSWKRSFQKREEQPGAPPGKEIRQTIYLDPYGGHYLFALDKPVSVAAEGLRKLPGFTFSLQGIPHQKFHYTVISVPSEILPEILPSDHPFLQLPEGFGPRIRELLERLLEDSGTQQDTLDRLQRFLLEGRYIYTLEELPRTENPLEDFLLVTRRGNCEYFASALAVLLRMAGIPSRIVGGYRGGNYNAAAGYYLVLQSHAHVWVEAHLPSKGWLRLDPTPSVPEGALKSGGSTFAMQLRLALDTFNFYWTRLVINYDFSKQKVLVEVARDLFRSPTPGRLVQVPQRTWTALSLALLGFSAVVLLVFLGKRQPLEKRLVTRFVKQLAAHGYERSPHEGLEEFIARIEEVEIREKSRVFVEELERIFYRDEPAGRERIAHMKRLLRDL